MPATLTAEQRDEAIATVHSVFATMVVKYEFLFE
jgi:hypothetical protein